MSRGLRWTAALLLPCLVPVLMALAAGPARAAEGELGLSADGRTWTDRLEAPLFDPAVRWVPGDARTARFYVRNQATTSGRMSVTAVRSRVEELLDTGWLTVAARVDDGAWQALERGGRRDLIDRERVAPGDEVAVEVRIGLAAAAPNDTMVLSTDLDLAVTLSDAAVSPDDAGPDEGGPDGPALPDTGSRVSWWLLPLALLFVGGGALIARAGREERAARDAVRGAVHDGGHPDPSDDLLFHTEEYRP